MKENNITSAFDFLELAHDYKKNRNHPSEIEFYRGHSNKRWRLLPSIYRKHMLAFEEDLVNEFIRRRPDEFSEEDGIFNILSKMQHYGLHTRLLDVTENPAVALFFACYDNFNEDGELFLFQNSLDEIPNNNVLNIITNFYIRQKNSNRDYNIEKYYKMMKNKYNNKDVEMAFYFMINGYYCFSRPKIISERILRQSGSFLLFPNEVCPKENCKNENCIHRDSNKCKKDNIAKEVEKRVENLSIRSSIYDDTDPHIKYNQKKCRYIVKSEYKKEILSELKTIGITEAFLFPELNNEGIAIMDEYYSRLNW